MSGFMDLLIPDDCGRRAFQETVADWREERARAESGLRRMAVDARATLAVTRVLAITASASLGRTDVWRGLTWTMVAGAVLTCLQLGFNVVSQEHWYLLSIDGLMLVPSGMAVFGAFAAAFGFGLKGNRAFPGLGLCAMLLAMTAIVVGYVAPVSNQYFRERIAAQLGTDPALVQASRGLAEQTAADLLERAASGDGTARQALVQRLALVAAAPAMLLLGAALRARLHRRRGWRTSQIAGGIASFVIFLSGGAVGAGLGELALITWPSLVKRELDTLPWWIAIAVSLTVTWFLARSSRREAATAGV